MPSTSSDPSLTATANIVSNGSSPSSDVWQFPDTPQLSIVNFQTVPSQPTPAGTSMATGLISPDLLLADRLKNFSPDVFDLSPDSALMHFLQALLGDSGVGQLRKRQAITRLQEGITGSQFYDLDSFYGALFGDVRGPAESLPLNPATGNTVSPYTDLASPDGWDTILKLDARFRERIIQLARAITLGGTVHGLRALAEAITGYKCHVYEIWRLLDNQGLQGNIISSGGTPTTINTSQITWYQFMASYPTWQSIPAGQTWSWLQGYTTINPGSAIQLLTQISPAFGGLGISCRNEVVIQPRRNYGTTLAAKQGEAADLYGITAVTEVLKPANVLLSVSQQAQQVYTPTPISALYADSEYWEITYTVSPPNLLDPAYAQAESSYQLNGQPVQATWSVPSPPSCKSQGTYISYAGAVTVAWAQGVQNGQAIDVADYETETIGGQNVTYTAKLALMDPVRASSTRTSGSVGVKAAPYAGPRVPVVPHS